MYITSVHNEEDGLKCNLSYLQWCFKKVRVIWCSILMESVSCVRHSSTYSWSFGCISSWSLISLTRTCNLTIKYQQFYERPQQRVYIILSQPLVIPPFLRRTCKDSLNGCKLVIVAAKGDTLCDFSRVNGSLEWKNNEILV